MLNSLALNKALLASKSSDSLPAAYVNKHSINFPVEMLLRLHNDLPAGSEARGMVVNYIRDYAERNIKAHWSRAIVVNAEGELVFDEARYLRAVYRGKQETRLDAAMESFKSLRDQLEFMASFQAEESKLAGMISAGVVQIAPLPDYSKDLAELQGKAEQLDKLATAMSVGLPNYTELYRQKC